MCIQSTYSPDNGGSIEEVPQSGDCGRAWGLDLIVILVPLHEVLHAFLH